MDNSMEFDSQWCHPVQSFGPSTEVANNEGNTCMSLAPTAVFCSLQEARKWVKHGKRQRVHLIWWLKYDEISLSDWQSLVSKDESKLFRWSLQHQCTVATVASWFVSSCGLWFDVVCVRSQIQLSVFAATSWPIFPRMLVSDWSCTVKLTVSEANIFPGFTAGLGCRWCKQHCPDVPTCMPQERKKRRLYDDSGLLRACSVTS